MPDTSGLTSLVSRFSAAETLNRFKAALATRGVTLFAEIDHAAGAAAVGLNLRSTVVLIFGNAKAGTPLMQRDQRIGIDLPLKALIWEDENGATQISYNEPSWVGERHHLADPVLGAMSNLLKALAHEAAQG